MGLEGLKKSFGHRWGFGTRAVSLSHQALVRVAVCVLCAVFLLGF